MGETREWLRDFLSKFQEQTSMRRAEDIYAKAAAESTRKAEQLERELVWEGSLNRRRSRHRRASEPGTAGSPST